MKRFEYLRKLTEHLLFLALMVPTIALLALAAVSIARPAHPSTVLSAHVMVAPPARANSVDERGHDGTY